MDEELLQVQSCKHVFHVHCIHHWLHNNTTCPLCRCLVIPISMSTKLDSNNPALVNVTSTALTEPAAQLQQHHSIIDVSHHSPGIVSLELRQQQQQQQQVNNNVDPNVTAAVEEESSSTAGTGGSNLRESGCSSSSTSHRDLGESVTIHIQDV